MSDSEQFLTVTPLGGLGEIGLNCQLWETSAGVVMVDCGLMFPDDFHLGVDVVIPHFGAVSAVRDKLLGIVLTHGHEDHIGALPWLVPQLRGTRIYGSYFTLALVEHKLREHELLDWVELCPVEPGDQVALGDMTFHFFPVCHSIPEGFGLGVETPVGRIVHSGDFKIDPQPLAGSGTDLATFRDFAGPEGARLLFSDSTNVERDGRSLTERAVMESLGKVFDEAPGRIVVTLFSSHIQRIQEVFDLARERGRTVVISGKSLANNIEMARDLGIAKLPPSFFNAHNGVPDLPDEQLVLVVTGAQGEPLSALSRMVLGGHRQLSIRKGDTVVMSSRMIPGNVKAVSRLINEMYRLGATVLYESVRAIHASGHAHRDELRELLGAVRPEYFVPVHGEYRHLKKHEKLAESLGMKPGSIVIADIGDTVELDGKTIKFGEKFPSGSRFVDGVGIDGADSFVLRDRIHLSEDGLIVAVVAVDEYSAELSSVEIIGKGLVLTESIINDTRANLVNALKQTDLRKVRDETELSGIIRRILKNYLFKVTKKNPMILPVVMVV